MYAATARLRVRQGWGDEGDDAKGVAKRAITGGRTDSYLTLGSLRSSSLSSDGWFVDDDGMEMDGGIVPAGLSDALYQTYLPLRLYMWMSTGVTCE